MTVTIDFYFHFIIRQEFYKFPMPSDAPSLACSGGGVSSFSRLLGRKCRDVEVDSDTVYDWHGCRTFRRQGVS